MSSVPHTGVPTADSRTNGDLSSWRVELTALDVESPLTHLEIGISATLMESPTSIRVQSMYDVIAQRNLDPGR